MSIRSSNRRQTLFITLACVVLPAIVVLSLLPNGDKSALHTKGRLHSPAHVLLFGLVAYAAGRISQSARTRIVVFVGVVFFGLGIEVAEHLTYHAALEWKDVLVDSAGVLVGTVIALVSASTEG
jgi:hypothetical protein